MFLSCTKKLSSKIKCADFQLQYPKVFEGMQNEKESVESTSRSVWSKMDEINICYR